MAFGRWIVRTHTGKKVVEKQIKFEPTPQKRKRKPPRGEERLKRLINENFGNDAVVKITYETDPKNIREVNKRMKIVRTAKRREQHVDVQLHGTAAETMMPLLAKAMRDENRRRANRGETKISYEIKISENC